MKKLIILCVFFLGTFSLSMANPLAFRQPYGQQPEPAQEQPRQPPEQVQKQPRQLGSSSENNRYTSAENPYKILPPTYNAGHVDLGVAKQDSDHPFFPSRAYTADGKKLDIGKFDKPEVCGSCHKKIYSQWKGSMHSNSWPDPIYRGLLKLASKRTGGKVDNLCLGCHAPVGLTTGQASATGENMSELASNGVQCDFCHNISAARGVGNQGNRMIIFEGNRL
ncbi:MAG: Cytochrome c554 and c-prime [Candidatus Kentron sp. G]|nr:MAG: Cytochrome c554 and c-prime [Candidatus Kentron sp. G]VFN01270.1 MAG: Cytochrome c554 and c-prime [Candidatus Kentron sp. G]VFN04168.1 MAG: Cytochrome c554 and c-prime [Candidatus Kentron sp. G]